MYNNIFFANFTIIYDVFFQGLNWNYFVFTDQRTLKFYSSSYYSEIKKIIKNKNSSSLDLKA